MSVMIKGMDMPTSCDDCPICYDMMECPVGKGIGFGRKDLEAEPFNFCNERHPRCPLVPVPEHGRLIDADEADKHAYDVLAVCSAGGYGSTWEAAREMQRIYRDMLTIIPGE